MQMQPYNEQPILSICICSIPKREEMFNSITKFVMNQFSHVQRKYNYGSAIAELLTVRNDFQNIGEKRNDLLKMSKGKYIVFIDDDDIVSDDYVESIIDALIENPDCDCVGIKGIITFDGDDEKKWEISKDFGEWFERDNVYYRTPNHISPIKTSIAQSVGFPNIADREDYFYSMGILPFLKNEVKIDKELYHYQYVTKK